MSDFFRDIMRQLGQPAACDRLCLVHIFPPVQRPGVGPEHETIGVAQEKRSPRGIQFAAGSDIVGAQRELNPEAAITIQHLADGRCGSREAGMCPNDFEPGLEGEQLMNGAGVGMGAQREISFDGEIDDAPHDRCLRLTSIKMEFTDAAIDPTFKFVSYICFDLLIAKPRAAIEVGAIRAQ